MIVQESRRWYGFCKGVAVTGKENPESMVYKLMYFVSEVNEDVADAYETRCKLVKKNS